MARRIAMDDQSRRSVLAGLIHRARTEKAERRATTLSAVRFCLICEQEYAADLSSGGGSGLDVTKGDRLIAECARQVHGGAVTAKAAALTLVRDIEARILFQHLGKAFEELESTRAATIEVLFTSFLTLLVSELCAAHAGVTAAASQAAHIAFLLGAPELSLAFLRMDYSLSVEACDLSRASHDARNLCLAIAGTLVGDSLLQDMGEMYAGPPWPTAAETQVLLTDALVSAIANRPDSSAVPPGLSEAILRGEPSIFVARAGFTSLEQYISKGHTAEALRALRFAADIADASRDYKNRVVAYGYMAQAHKAQGTYSLAIEAAAKALGACPEGEWLPTMTCLDVLITIEAEAGRLADARRHYARLVSLLETHPDLAMRPRVLFLGGLLEMAEGRWQAAVELFENAERLNHYLPEENRAHTRSAIRNNIVQCRARLGQDSRPSTDSIEAPISTLSKAHSAMAAAHGFALTDARKAIGQFEAAARLFGEAANPGLAITALFNGAVTAVHANLWAEAVRMLDVCTQGTDRHGMPPNLSRETLNGLAAASKWALDTTGHPTGEATGDFAAIFQRLYDKAMLGVLDDAEVAAAAKDETTLGSICASCIANLILPRSDEELRAYTELASKAMNLAKREDPLFCLGIGHGLAKMNRPEQAEPLLIRAYDTLKSNAALRKLISESLIGIGTSASLSYAADAAALDMQSNSEGDQLNGLVLSGRLAENGGAYSDALRAYERAWELAKRHSESTAWMPAIAERLALLYLRKLENVQNAARWLGELRKAAQKPNSAAIDEIAAGIAMLSGDFDQARGLFDQLRSLYESRGETSNEVDAEINLAILDVARGELVGAAGRREIESLIGRCKTLGMNRGVNACAKLLGDFLLMEGSPEEARSAYMTAAEGGEAPEDLRRSLKLMAIQDVADLSERLAQMLELMKEWGAQEQARRHLASLYLLAARLLNANVQPRPRAMPLLADFTPPTPQFSAAFECCRLAENIARDAGLNDQLPEILREMGFALFLCRTSGSLITPSGALVEARRLALAQLEQSLNSRQARHWMNFIDETDCTTLSMASKEGNDRMMKTAFANIRSQPWRWLQRLPEAITEEEGSVTAAEARSVAAEIRTLRRMRDIAGTENSILRERHDALVARYTSLWRQLDAAQPGGRPKAISASEPVEIPQGLLLVDIAACRDKSFALVRWSANSSMVEIALNEDDVLELKSRALEGARTRRLDPVIESIGEAVWPVIERFAAGIESIALYTDRRWTGVPIHAALASLSRKGVFYAVGGQRFETTKGKKVQRALSFIDPQGDLPGAHVEAARLKEILPQLVIRKGEQVSWHDLRKGASDADILHIACHGDADPVDEKQSELIFYGGDRVRLSDFADSFNLVAECVLLSACGSAASGDILTGRALPLMLIGRGARMALGAQWALPDAVAAILIPEFCRKWISGMRPAVALAEAVHDLRSSTEEVTHEAASDEPTSGTRSARRPFADAFHWASCALYGDGWTPLR